MVLWEILTGAVPFDEEGESRIIRHENRQTVLCLQYSAIPHNLASPSSRALWGLRAALLHPTTHAGRTPIEVAKLVLAGHAPDIPQDTPAEFVEILNACWSRVRQCTPVCCSADGCCFRAWAIAWVSGYVYVYVCE